MDHGTSTFKENLHPSRVLHDLPNTPIANRPLLGTLFQVIDSVPSWFALRHVAQPNGVQLAPVPDQKEVGLFPPVDVPEIEAKSVSEGNPSILEIGVKLMVKFRVKPVLFVKVK